MARSIARLVTILSALCLYLGSLSGISRAQEAYLYGLSHPYIATTQTNASGWRSGRAAARFNYNPYVAGYSPRVKPFSSAAPLSRTRSGGFGSRRPGYLIDEFAEELEYYGFDDFAEEFGSP